MSIKLTGILTNIGKAVNKIEKGKMGEETVEKATSIFNKSATSTNSIVMDAKATLSQLKVTKPINENFYQSLKKDFDSKINKLIYEQNIQTYKNINPINHSNISEVKADILNTLCHSNDGSDKNIIKELIERISNCKKPDELFEIFKDQSFYNAIGKQQQQEINEFVNGLKLHSLNDITAANEISYSKINSDYNKKLNIIIETLSPKSKKTEVVKIEQELKEMGIENVNLSDDLEQAKLVREGMQDLISAKIKLPNSITVTPLLPKDVGGCANNYVENMAKKRCIFLPRSEEIKNLYGKNDLINKVTKTSLFMDSPIEYQQKYLEDASQYFEFQSSTNNPKGGIYHEVRHTLEDNTLKASFIPALIKGKWENIGEGVSGYAKESISEFKSEAFAKLMSHEDLSEEQMKLYMMFDGGIVPQFN